MEHADHAMEHVEHAMHGAATHAAHVDRAHFLSAVGDPYSLFMHRTSGYILLALGALFLADRITQHRHKGFQLAFGAMWVAFFPFIFFMADPDAWPIGGSITDSLAQPGKNEWMQHKAFSLVPLIIGLWTFSLPQLEFKPKWCFIFGSIFALGGIGLFFHEHSGHHHMDNAQIEHIFMGIAILFTAAAAYAEGLPQLAWKYKSYLMPIGFMILGLELAVYFE